MPRPDRQQICVLICSLASLHLCLASGGVTPCALHVSRLTREIIESQGISLEEALRILKQYLPRTSVLVGQSIGKDVDWLQLREGQDYQVCNAFPMLVQHLSASKVLLCGIFCSSVAILNVQCGHALLLVLMISVLSFAPPQQARPSGKATFTSTSPESCRVMECGLQLRMHNLMHCCGQWVRPVLSLYTVADQARVLSAARSRWST